MTTAQERIILAKAALIKKEQVRERKAKLKAERKARGTVDRGRERDNGFLAYLRRQPCEAADLGGCSGPTDPAHIRYGDGPGRLNPGGGRKNHDRHCNPLCRAHHDEQHAMAERYFWSRIGKDAYDTAAGHYAAYLAGADGPTRKVLRQAADDETEQVGTPEGVNQAPALPDTQPETPSQSPGDRTS